MEITNILFKIMKISTNILKVSESYLQIQENSGKFSAKFEKFGKIYWKFYLKIQKSSWHESVVRIWPSHHNFFLTQKKNMKISNLFEKKLKDGKKCSNYGKTNKIIRIQAVLKDKKCMNE